MTERKSTTIPIQCGARFKEAIRTLAWRKRTTMAELVIAAVKDAYGKELDSIFFALNDANQHQNDTTDASKPKNRKA